MRWVWTVGSMMGDGGRRLVVIVGHMSARVDQIFDLVASGGMC